MTKPMEQLIIYGERNYIPLRNMHFKDINPLDAGFQECSAGFGEAPHKRGNYIFHHIISGTGTFCTDGKKYTLSKGDTFLIRPGKEISYYASEENPWSYIWVGFNGASAKWLDTISDDIFNLNRKLFEDIQESATFSNARELFLSGCISIILSHILDSRKNLDIVSTVKGYISSGNIYTLKIPEIAALLNISAKHLSRVFKQETGISLNSYFMQKKMERAKYLLSIDYNVAEISRLLGYADPTTFFRAFKNFYGYPPSKHKKMSASQAPVNPDVSKFPQDKPDISESTLKEKMELADQYIKQGYKISEVAQFLGYTDDIPYYSTEFRTAYEKHFGHPPLKNNK